jgi:hypothetical protein
MAAPTALSAAPAIAPVPIVTMITSTEMAAKAP